MKISIIIIDCFYFVVVVALWLVDIVQCCWPKAAVQVSSAASGMKVATLELMPLLLTASLMLFPVIGLGWREKSWLVWWWPQ